MNENNNSMEDGKNNHLIEYFINGFAFNGFRKNVCLIK